MASSCLTDIFLSSSPEVLGFWFCLLRTLPNNSLSYYLFPLTGRSPHFRFGVPANHLASLFFPSGQAIFLGLLDVTQVPFFFHQVTQYKHLFFHSNLGLLLWDWPTFFHVLTAILWRLATFTSNGRIVLILFLSSPWDTMWQYNFWQNRYNIMIYCLAIYWYNLFYWYDNINNFNFSHMALLVWH